MLHSHTWAYGGQVGLYDFVCTTVYLDCYQGDRQEENYRKCERDTILLAASLGRKESFFNILRNRQNKMRHKCLM